MLQTTHKNGSKKDLSQTVRWGKAGHFFESLRNAQRALKNDLKLRRGVEQGKDIAVLSRMHRSGDRLTHASVRRELLALVNAAEAYFGSWGKFCVYNFPQFQ